MRKLQKIIALAGATAAVLWVCCQPISKIGLSKEYESRPKVGQKISAKELKDFLTLWSRIDSSALRDEIAQVSLKNQKGYSTSLTRWLKAEKWNVERFFYDDARIRAVLECVTLKENLKANQILKNSGNFGLKDIIEHQEKSLQNCRYEDNEMRLIELNRRQIMDILTDRALERAP